MSRYSEQRYNMMFTGYYDVGTHDGQYIRWSFRLLNMSFTNPFK